MYSLVWPCGLECQGHHFCQVLPFWTDTKSGQIHEYVSEHILQCNQSEPLADASGRKVDLMNENDSEYTPTILIQNDAA